MGAIDPRGVANLDSRGMIGWIYVGYHLTLLHTKYTGFRPCGFTEDFFKCFPIISLWQIMIPRGMAGIIYKGDFQTLLHIKYKSSEPHGLIKVFFYMFSYCKSIEALIRSGPNPNETFPPPQ